MTKKIYVVTEIDPIFGRETKSFKDKGKAEEYFMEIVNHLFDWFEVEIDDEDRTKEECLADWDCNFSDRAAHIDESYLFE